MRLFLYLKIEKTSFAEKVPLFISNFIGYPVRAHFTSPLKQVGKLQIRKVSLQGPAT